MKQSPPARRATENTNQRDSGTRTTAETHCTQKGGVPSLAEPRPRAWPSGERMLMGNSLFGVCHGPGRDSEKKGNNHHGVTGGVGGLELVALADVPAEVTDAVAQVVHERPPPAEEQDLSVPGREVLGEHAVALRTTRKADQPAGE